MTEMIGTAASGHPNLNLNVEEKKLYGQLLKEADPDGFGAVSGDVAVKFFEKTKLPPDVLGQIWQIADTENRGFLTPSGFGVVLRLIGHAQAGRSPSAQLATQPAPLPRFEGQPIQSVPAQTTGPPSSPGPPSGPPPIRVPALTPDKVSEYTALFDKSGAENGALSGFVAKQIFERARLPNEVLGRIWNLSDTHSRGSLDVTEFIIAMHLLASYKSGAMRGVPSTLPPGLYEAASRRIPTRAGSGSRPGSSALPPSGVPPQFTGFGNARPQSPIARQQVGTPLSSQSTGDGWVITPVEKARFDNIYATLDKQGRGFITGEQAVEFFGNARLPEEVLAQIWDLADINSEGQLNRDEFAVAMYLIRQQRGTKDGRGNLPSTLPPALIPPSMRRQQIAPPQSTAPAFENAPVTKPRSAADDLFGLDAFGPTPPANSQHPQSTGGTDAGPFTNPSSPKAVTSGPPAATSTFKPFIPSSSFGQSIIPQQSGPPSPRQARAPPPTTLASDDLLGDGDPEVSKRLTSETSELANLSNQVGSLSKQMTEVQGTRAQTEQELSQNTMQKRAFEGRLAQLRSMYEKEVQEVKTLQEQLTTSKNDTKRLQQDMAVIDGSHQDLTTQHQQIRASFEADQRENTALKERMRQINSEVEHLKPQLEKLKSDARQQKGLVAINKKQVATNEAERDRIKAEMAAAQKQVEDSAREVEESNRQVQDSQMELEEARNAPPPPPPAKSPPAASPAPSASSNPFFRRNTAETNFSPPLTSHEEKNETQNSFDSIFGPSFGGLPATPAPVTSFGGTSTGGTRDISSSSETPDMIEPPPPPSSKQITSESLPFRTPLDRDHSVTSSVKVAPPTSRLSPADTPRAVTPSTSASSPDDHKEPTGDPFLNAGPDEEQESIKKTLPTSHHDDFEDTFGKATNEKLGGIPGAFPGFDTPRATTPIQPHHPASTSIVEGAAAMAGIAGAAGVTAAAANGEHESKPNDSQSSTKDRNVSDSNFDEFFGGPAHQRTASEQVADFDSAFDDMKNGHAVNEHSKATTNPEFPDIQELDHDDDDDDEDDSSTASGHTPMGFDDDFNSRSPPKASETSPSLSNKAGKQPEVDSAVPSQLQVPRPPLESASSTHSSLPGVDQQKSPPTYEDIVPNDDPNHFPREFKGLLPEREIPTSPPMGSTSRTGMSPGADPPAYGPEIPGSRKASESKPMPSFPNKSSPFDFDSAFAGVGPAQVEEDDEEDVVDGFKSSRNQGTEFDPTFDSPEHSRMTTASSNAPTAFTRDGTTNGSPQQQKDRFWDFGKPLKDEAPTMGAAQIGSASGEQSSSHDWDDLFSGFSSGNPAPADGLANPTQEHPSGMVPPQNTRSAAAPIGNISSPTAATSPPQTKRTNLPARPTPGRALSTGTEHDDPILKRLTAMGFSRDESLSALEKFDYNIDKAADYLTFKS